MQLCETGKHPSQVLERGRNEKEEDETLINDNLEKKIRKNSCSSGVWSFGKNISTATCSCSKHHLY